VAVGGTGVAVGVGEGSGVTVGGKGVLVGKGVKVKVAEGSGIGVRVLVAGSGVKVGRAVEVGVSSGGGVLVIVGSSTSLTVTPTGEGVAVAISSGGGRGVSVGARTAIEARVGWPLMVGSEEGVSGEVETVVSEGAAPCLKVANHPPKNKAVMATHMKIESRARRARWVSSSLTIGKIALLASR
jgi:hypothetical protein